MKSLALLLVALALCVFAEVAVPSGPNVPFVETFNDDAWRDRWIISQVTKFSGVWEVQDPIAPNPIPGDKVLVATNAAQHHAISTAFKDAVDNNDKDLFVQYEVRLTDGLECGGAYIKLLRKDSMPADSKEFSNETPYSIMFGPDKCGSTNKVHLIINHMNPVSKKWEEKHLKDAPRIKEDKLTHLYGLRLTSDDKYEMYIDGEKVKEGNMNTDFQPAFTPPQEIDDPTDKKPSDWVEEAKIPDPTATKPDDWDENAPAQIPDEDAKKPDTWLDNEPEMIPDPAAQKPSDWDDEMDGQWEAPQIPNPKCKEFGCGEWKRPMKANPAYKGKWHAPMIDNPAYKGPWKAKQIPNPDYFVEEHPHHVSPIGGIGIEIWTMQQGITFDNIVVSYDKAAIEEFTKNTFMVKKAEESKPKETAPPTETPTVPPAETPAPTPAASQPKEDL